MSVCVTAAYLDSRNIYPVLDPRRTAGPGPFSYGYGFAWDGVQIDVARTAGLTSCQMIVNFIPPFDPTPLPGPGEVVGLPPFNNGPEGKVIQAYDLTTNSVVQVIGSPNLALNPPLSSSMTIQKASCGVASPGVHTVVLCRWFAWPRGLTPLYTFEPEDFWDFWGGCTVTFNWVTDKAGSGKWGDETPEPTYPIVRLPDNTVMREPTGSGFGVVFGGTDFVITDPNYLGLAFAAVGGPQFAVPFVQLPPFPADGTLLREFNRNEEYLVYGGMKFYISDSPTLLALGLGSTPVRVIPPGGISKLTRTVPIDGTLIAELSSLDKIYLVQSGKRRRVQGGEVTMDRNCLPLQHVRIVPDNSGLAAIPTGPDIT
jgi:hypothetical protein